MPTHRVIEKTAGTGERTGSLSHLGFRVWLQYQLSADDYGVCPADAKKLQGDNPALAAEPTKRIQEQIERLIEVKLCGEFQDGQRRYLYQLDWQTYQRIKHPSKTALPPVPPEELEKCCEKTKTLFLQFHPKIAGDFRPHANATANADAIASAEQTHPIKSLLTVHEQLFRDRYHATPAKYGAREAKTAKDLIAEKQFDGAVALVRQLFASADPFIAKSGHAITLLASGAIQNRLIAELSGRAPNGDGFDGLREFVKHG